MQKFLRTKDIDYKRFEDEVLRAIALLLGLTVFNMAIVWFAPFIVPNKWLIEFMSYCGWIGRVIFGMIMFILSGSDRKTKISISLLSAMAPYYGALFFLLISTIKKPNK